MNLNEFFNYKNNLMKDILTNKTIVDLLTDGKPIRDPSDLAYTQVFPCEYLPETVSEGKTYICFDVDIRKDMNQTFYYPTIYVWVFSHKTKLRLSEGKGVRTDAICAEIANMLNGSMKYGLGKLDLRSVVRFAPMTDYNGRCMSFYATDFSKTFNGNKIIPNKRGVL